MFYFTKQERTVLTVFALVLWLGTMLRYAFKQNPSLASMVNLIEHDRVYYKIDVNKATEKDLDRIPYIGPSTAKKIVLYREKHKILKNVDELKSIPGIREENYKIFSKYLKTNSP